MAKMHVTRTPRKGSKDSMETNKVQKKGRPREVVGKK